MSSNVIDLSERRERRDTEPTLDKGYAACGTCGGGWFRLIGGAVCFGTDGRVTGYTGTPECVSCYPRGTA